MFNEESQVYFFPKPNDLINQLSPEQIKIIMEDLGADRHEEFSDHLIFPTICHNEDSSEASLKLYYYFDSKLFFCFTECNRSYTIVQLVEHIRECEEKEAIKYIYDLIGGTLIVPKNNFKYYSIKEKFMRQLGLVELKEYNKNVLESFYKIPYDKWLQEGMKWNVLLNDFNIRLYPDKEEIVIPHLDYKGRLIGIRVRNLKYATDPSIPKYGPLAYEDIVYKHPLGLNLYGAYENKIGIASSKHAIVFEGEKSVILHKTYFGDASNAVAICVSYFSKSQLDILIKVFKVNHITIALDKEFVNYNSPKANAYFSKLWEMGREYENYARIDFIIDKKGLLNEKDSPIDKGKDIFNFLYNMKVRVGGT